MKIHKANNDCCCKPVYTCCCPPYPPCPPCPEPPTLFYSVIYLPNGGTGGLADSNIAAGSIYTVKTAAQAALSRPGYTFTGWNTSPDGSGAAYLPGETIILNANIVLYAQWLRNVTYTVSYNANGGTGAYSDTGLGAGSSYTIRGNGSVNIIRPGYTFTGWNTSPDGSGTAYFPGEQINVQGNLTLYAQWQLTPPNTYTVTYHNNLSPSASYQAPPVTIGNAHSVLSYNATGLPVPPTGSFMTWNTQPYGNGTSFLPGTAFAFDTDTDLYAIWILPT